MWKIIRDETQTVNVFSHITLADNYIFLYQYAGKVNSDIVPPFPHIFPIPFVLYLIRGHIYHGRMGETFDTPSFEIRVISLNMLYDLYLFVTHVTRDND